MNETKTIVIDAYPWAQPTEAQKAYFDSLPPEAQRRMLEAAIEEGFNSGLSDKSTEELLADVKSQSKNEDQKDPTG